MIRQVSILLALATASLLLAIGCNGNRPKPNQIFLMPAPGIYAEGDIDPFIDNDPISRGLRPGVLFATDRAPAGPDDSKFEYYSDGRGDALSVGIANIKMGIEGSVTWEEARRISLLKNRTQDYPLEIDTLTVFGPLEATVALFVDGIERSEKAGSLFAEEINRRLAVSPKKDVYIYVHGYKVAFENPILVASELWHFLGYNGAFVAFSWPATYKLTAYFSDLDDAANSARNLRNLVLHIAETTDVEKIHIVGYSAGTRVVSRMLADLGMYGYFFEKNQIQPRVKLGKVILIGSDVDRNILAGYLLDGALRIPDSLTIYQSAADDALKLARRVFGRDRVGQVIETEALGASARQYIEDHRELQIIDVTDAEGGTAGNGHWYFRSSPWVSSDILMTLLYDLGPAERGLVASEKLPVWTFPDDYVERLRASLTRTRPELSGSGTP